MNKKFSIILLLLFICSPGIKAQQPGGYQLPPREITDIVDAPVTPSLSLSPANDMILLTEYPGLPSIEHLAAEEYRLAGIRFDPATNGPSRARYGTGFSLTTIEGKNPRVVQGLPKSPVLRDASWSADGKKIAFTNTTGSGIELWVIDVETAIAKKITGAVINDIMGNAFSWVPGSNTIVYSAIPEDRGKAPAAPEVSQGPVIQESLGKKAAVRTYQDLLQNPYDEKVFDYYTTSQVMLTDLQGNKTRIGKPGVIWYFSPSPDGSYLMMNRIQKPYSYIVPFTRFPQNFEVYNTKGDLVKVLAEIPLSEELPQGFGAVRQGPRSFTWRNDAPATIYWVEALDGGDPQAEAEYRDQVFSLEAPFEGDPVEGVKLNLRYSGITWGKDDFAIIRESWRKTRLMKISSFNPGDPSEDKKVIFEMSTEDRYNDPGNFRTEVNENGQWVLQFDRRGRKLFLSGAGASPEGNFPFLDEYDIRTGKIKRLWQSEAPYYEVLVRIVDVNRPRIITRRESNEMQPNYYLRDLRRNTLSQITDFPDPYPQLRNISKEMIHYVREDGVTLSGTLYLPEGYRPGVDEPLPTILWAYPREYKSADAAGQVSGSPYTFTRVGATSPIILATQGYAVLNNASFPIIGEGDEEPNDTFVEQLVANAQAAIDKLAEMQVTDPSRVGVSGHSYGAFMTANLLTHSDLFAAGVARSGAYNRSLTPFGFQSEERTYWQAPEVYHTMSPFSNAHKVEAPLLLIHGAADNNSGTFPLQSERYYDALRGQGAITRLVMLPHESHGYQARESVLHMHWEWLQWFDTYVKNKETAGN